MTLDPTSAAVHESDPAAGHRTAAVPFREPLADALLPALMHRLNNATQLLAALGALFANGGGEALLGRRAGDLAEASDTVDELGWVLAVLATAGGADLVLERRSRAGLATMLGAVRDALGREGVTLEIEGAVPTASPAVGDGWQLAWAVGALAWGAGSAHARGGRMRVAFRRVAAGEDGEGEWEVSFAPAPGSAGALEATLARVERELPESRVARASNALALRVPAAWLAPGAAQRT